MFPITLEAIRSAQASIQAYIHKTPLFRLETLGALPDKELYLKAESFQLTGSFKMRGATHCVLKNLDQVRSRGAVAASAGNHAQALAAICHKLGAKATIIMPTETPAIKTENTKNGGPR